MQYLFVYYVTSTTFNDPKIIAVYESETEFKPGVSYFDKDVLQFKNQEKVTLPFNKIGSTKIQNREIKDKNDFAQTYQNINDNTIIKKIDNVDDNYIILFSIYNSNDSSHVTSYCTKGSIYFKQTEIVSTEEIIQMNNDSDINDTCIKKLYKIVANTPVNIQIVETNKKKQNPNQQAIDKYYLYFNSISPDSLVQTLRTKISNIQIKELLEDIIQYLYIDISIRQDSDIANYSKLYSEIYNFYKSSNNKAVEFGKEYFSYKGLKINKLTEKISNITDAQKKYDNHALFVIHIADFDHFLDYLKNNKSPLQTLANDIYNKNKNRTLKEKTKEQLNNIKAKIESETTSIYTYLKISNFESTNNAKGKIPSSNRFLMQPFGKDMDMIQIGYFSINKPLYAKKTDGTIEKLFEYNDNGQVLKYKTKTETKTYTHDKYIFGPFNNIFKENDSIDFVVSELDGLYNKITSGKPVVLMGYGASGSGKTSTLIYFNKNGQPGILVKLCNKLATDGKYIQLEVKCVEMFEPYYFDESNSHFKKINNTVQTKDPDTFTFNYNNNNFKLNAEQKYKIRHQYRVGESEKTFANQTNLGDVIAYLIDEDRLVKATTNNPNSSRSHVLCFLKLTKKVGDKEEHAYIIICDLAGVENQFKCQDSKELEKFFNIKKDNSEDKFYKGEFDKDGKFDVLYGGNPDTYNTDDKTSITDSFKSQYFDFTVTSIINFYKKNGMFKSLLKDINYEQIETNDDYNIKNLKKKKFKRMQNFVTNIIEMLMIFLFVDDPKNYNLIVSENKSLIDKLSELQTNIIITNNTQYFEKMNNSSNVFEEPLNDKTFLNNNTFLNMIFNNQDKIQKYHENYVNLRHMLLKPDVERETLNQELNKKTNRGGQIKYAMNDTERYVQNYSEIATDLNNAKSVILRIGLLFINKIKECLLYNRVIKSACDHRLTEGNFINTSLQELTSDILKVVDHKNMGNPYFVPRLNLDCMSSYCSSKKSCFELPLIQDQNIKSVILSEIKKGIGKTYADDNAFYADVELCVFCIFNHSRLANNPPPVPYIDINELKQYFYQNYDNKDFQASIYKEKVSNAYNKARLSFILESDLQPLNALSKIQINNEGVTIEIYNQIHVLITKIDNTNAVSAIGTIEFLDRISKSNTINNVCLQSNV